MGAAASHSTTANIRSWAVNDVANYAEEAGFGTYAEQLQAKGIDGDTLLRLTALDLKLLGMSGSDFECIFWWLEPLRQPVFEDPASKEPAALLLEDSLEQAGSLPEDPDDALSDGAAVAATERLLRNERNYQQVSDCESFVRKWAHLLARRHGPGVRVTPYAASSSPPPTPTPPMPPRQQPRRQSSPWPRSTHG